MPSDSLAELLGVQPAGLADHREQPQLDRAEQRRRTPECEPQRHDRVTRHRLRMLDGCRAIRLSHWVSRFEKSSWT